MGQISGLPEPGHVDIYRRESGDSRRVFFERVAAPAAHAPRRSQARRTDRDRDRCSLRT